MPEVHLRSPMVNVTTTVESRWQWLSAVIAWIVFWTFFFLCLVYLYAFEIPKVIGFETTALVGLGIIVLTQVFKDG